MISIDKLVEIDDTLISFIDLSSVLPISSITFILEDTSVHQKMKTEFMLTVNFIDNWVELKEKKHENVKLKGEDMPGAILPQEKPAECTVKQLQRWLLYHGAKTTRKKTKLIQR